MPKAASPLQPERPMVSPFPASLVIFKMQIRTRRYHLHLSDMQRSKGLITPYLDEGMGGRHSCLVSGRANPYTLFPGQAGDILNLKPTPAF